ncbi:hypothetical protein FRB96_002396 [Tulasnella sp. 330]|nr:hypothetical protein FRB96_002396 [Tulasnella sp. 330]
MSLRHRVSSSEDLFMVIVWSTSVGWSPSFLSGLKTLHLEALGTANRISVPQLITALRESPGLTDLWLGRDAVHGSCEREDTDPVDLPLLITLPLEPHPRAAHDILTLLCTPRCVDLDIISLEATDIEFLDVRMTHILTVIH